MRQPGKERTAFLKSLDENRLDEAFRILKSFSQDELADLVFETLMVERVVKAKIRFLREELWRQAEE